MTHPDDIAAQIAFERGLAVSAPLTETVHLCDEASQPDIHIACDNSWTTPKWAESGDGMERLVAPHDDVFRADDDRLYAFFDVGRVTCAACKATTSYAALAAMTVAEAEFLAARLRGEVTMLEEKVRRYERDYILPLFRWATEDGFDLQQMVFDNPGKTCAELYAKEMRRRVKAAEPQAGVDAPALDPEAEIAEAERKMIAAFDRVESLRRVGKIVSSALPAVESEIARAEQARWPAHREWSLLVGARRPVGGAK